MNIPERKNQQAEKRNLVSSFFVTLLIGVAYQEMVLTVRASLDREGLTLTTLLLAAIFLFISMRFFIGNQLHLLGDSFTRLPGLLWLFDLLVIITQSIVLILIGSYSTKIVNDTYKIGFVEYIVALYSIDIIWILSQSIMCKINPKWTREFIPKGWAILNFILIISIIAARMTIKAPYSEIEVILLFIINFMGFIGDVVLIDYYDAI